MAEQPQKDRRTRPISSPDASVDALASRALSLVAERNAGQANQMQPKVAQALHDAAIQGERNDVPRLIDEMLKSGIRAEVIADIYIPHVARMMGDEWCEDQLSFARVTIGTARLQSALRLLGSAWNAFNGSIDDAAESGAAVIVLVVRDSYHTLGAFVLAGQLRRLGLSVRVSLGPSRQEVESIFRDGVFDAVLISANETDTLDSLSETVKVIRTSASNEPPIVVGGGIVDLVADVLARTGADFVTNDPYEALKHCGLTRNKKNTPQPNERRT